MICFMKRFKFNILLLVLLSLPVFAYAESISLKDKVFGNGELAILEFEKNSIDKIAHENKTLHIVAHPTNNMKKIVFYPISYYVNSDVVLDMYVKNRKFPTTLHIKPKDYKKEVLSVEPSKATPSKEISRLIKEEVEEASKIYTTFTNERYWDSTFTLPMKSKITSGYGNARVFNGALKSYHAGTDFRAPIGSEIYSTNRGKVVLAKKRYLAGLSVVIDHGEGIYSCYFHLSKTDLKVGDMIEKGKLIGLSGNSGRVTGPHLHFSIVVNGIPVDSINAIENINRLF